MVPTTTLEESARGATIVNYSYYCTSKSPIWNIVALGWNVILLFWATVLAFQTRSIRQEFNESRTLMAMIYVHFIFVIFRVGTFFLSSFARQAILALVRSILYSADTTATILIYFIPKLVAATARNNRSMRITAAGGSSHYNRFATSGSFDFGFGGGPQRQPGSRDFDINSAFGGHTDHLATSVRFRQPHHRPPKISSSSSSSKSQMLDHLQQQPLPHRSNMVMVDSGESKSEEVTFQSFACDDEEY